MDACQIYQLNCLQNIIDEFINKLIKNKCKLNNEKNVKQILLKIIKKNSSILKNSFAFLFTITEINYAISWNEATKVFDVNISNVCQPDSTSLRIMDAYLNSELISGSDFAKISCFFNNLKIKGKIFTLKQIFQISTISGVLYAGAAAFVPVADAFGLTAAEISPQPAGFEITVPPADFSRSSDSILILVS